MTQPLPSIQRLRHLFLYDPSTGLLIRRIPTGPKTLAGTVAGYLNDGYVNVTVDGRTCRAHRVAWAIHTGDWPVNEVDHRHGKRADNRWDNLRDVTKQVNTENQRFAQAGNPSGFLGVHPRASGRFQAVICSDKKNRTLGTYDTSEEAHAVYLKAKRDLHPGCTI